MEGDLLSIMNTAKIDTSFIEELEDRLLDDIDEEIIESIQNRRYAKMKKQSKQQKQQVAEES